MYYGAQLAHDLGASVVLTHIYQVQVSMTDMPVMLFSVEELKKNTENSLERCQKELKQKYPDLSIRTESRLGSIPDELNILAEEINPLFIVMGSHNTKGIERILLGSTTASVIRHSHHPVMAVPVNNKTTSIQNIVLAADLEEVPDSLCRKIVDIVSLLRANLHIVHVKVKEETEKPEKLLQKLASLNPTYESIASKKVQDGLLQFVQSHNADLLIFLPHEHNLVERLFFTVHTEDILSATNVPVLAVKA